MSTNFCILRLEKIKTKRDIIRRGNHNTRGHKKAAQNADPTRAHLNKILRGSKDVLADVTKRYEELGVKPRKNGVLATEMFLGYSPGGVEEKDLAKWVRKNMRWLDKKFGKENIVSAVLHRDETTPHIHVVLLPVHHENKNGKPAVSHKRLFGDGYDKDGVYDEKCSRLQNEYAEAMKEFGLERGLKGSKAVHQTAKEFRREAQRELEEAKKLVASASKGANAIHKSKPPKVFGIRDYIESIKDRYKKYIKKLKEQMSAQVKMTKRLENENRRLRKILEAALELQKDGIDIERVPNELKNAKASEKHVQIMVDNAQANGVKQGRAELEPRVAELEQMVEIRDIVIERNNISLTKDK